MPKKTFHYYLLKLARLSGWLLLPFVVLYIGTGFALCGMLGFSKWMDLQTALVDPSALRLAAGGPVSAARDNHVLLRHAEVGMDQEPQRECRRDSPAEKS